ncbi:MAG: PorP/SprF family type IX secretion system membrane protein [Bacteroidota bacterium]
MQRYFLSLVLLFFFMQHDLKGQLSGFGPGYQASLARNPGITGSAGDGHLRLSYLNLYPGSAYDLHSASVSFDGFFPSIHGGAGFFISNEYLGGIVNDLKAGFSYSYFFQAGRNMWFSAGLSASFYHRGFSTGGIVLPDQIDPLRGSVLPSGESLAQEGRTVFDIGAGFVFYSGKFSGGLAVNHLAEPDLSLNDLRKGKLGRTLFMHLAGNFENGVSNKLSVLPLLTAEVQKGCFSGAAGAAISLNHLSFNAMLLTGNGRYMDLQSGFSVGAGVVSLFYNYRFNIISGESLLPFSLQHHTGMALRLNNVDKRKIIKTIKFPIL